MRVAGKHSSTKVCKVHPNLRCSGDWVISLCITLNGLGPNGLNNVRRQPFCKDFAKYELRDKYIYKLLTISKWKLLQTA